MKLSNNIRIGVWLFIIGLLTFSSVAITITLLEWNMQNAQQVLSTESLNNESLSRYPFTFPEELTKAQIQKNAYSETDSIVPQIINQYLLVINSKERLRYRTDTVLGIEPAKRPLTLADQEIIKSLNAELNANPSEERRLEIEAELKRIHEETTSRAGTDQVTTHINR